MNKFDDIKYSKIEELNNFILDSLNEILDKIYDYKSKNYSNLDYDDFYDADNIYDIIINQIEIARKSEYIRFKKIVLKNYNSYKDFLENISYICPYKFHSSTFDFLLDKIKNELNNCNIKDIKINEYLLELDNIAIKLIN